jgi:hypothetical protein
MFGGFVEAVGEVTTTANVRICLDAKFESSADHIFDIFWDRTALGSPAI